MVYTMFILLIFSITLVIRKYTSRHSLVLLMLVIFLDMAILASILYISKCGNYYYPKQWILLLDYKGYLLLSKANISFYNIIRLQNIGFAGFLSCLPLFALDNKLFKARKKKIILITLGILVLPLSYIIFYDPLTKISIYFYIYKLPDEQFEGVVRLLNNLNRFNNMWIIMYVVFPLYQMISLYKRSELPVKRQQLLSLVMTLATLEFLCIFIFFWGPFRQTYDVVNVDTLHGFPPETTIPLYYYTWLPMITLIIANILFIVLLKFRGLDNIDFFRNFVIKRIASSSNKNIRDIFHGFKNIIFTIKILAQQLQSAKTQEEKDFLIGRLIAVSDNSMDNITRVLNSFKIIDNKASINDVSASMNSVLERVNTKDIVVNRNYADKIYAYCDLYNLEEALINILNNATEAIMLSGRSGGMITIDIKTEYEWIVIKITDNGIGVPKKDLNKIFRAFYTTKSTQNNWGVGLHSVFRNIREMKGFVYVQSEEGKFTTFSIMLQHEN